MLKEARKPCICQSIALSIALFVLGFCQLAVAMSNGKSAIRADFEALSGASQHQSFIVYYRSASRAGDIKAFARQKLSQIEQNTGFALEFSRAIFTGGWLIHTRAPLSSEEAKTLFQAFLQQPDMEFIEPDRVFKPLMVPNDPRYGQQWHYFEPTGGVNLPAAWGMVNGTGVTVAVIDTGITNHPDLAANIVGGYDFIHQPDSTLPGDFVDPRDGDGPDPNPRDEGDWTRGNDCTPSSDGTKPQGGSANPAPGIMPGPGGFVKSSWHGTHVAGTIAAIANNGVGVTGVAPGAKILPVRVLGKCGGRLLDVVQGISWAAGGTAFADDGSVIPNPHPAQVLNLSFGMGSPSACLPQSTLQRAINSARDQGAVVVVAAGNNSSLANYPPANCQGVITVAATDREGNLAAYSNFGPNITVSAPGGEIFATLANGVLSTHNNGSTTPSTPAYHYLGGTSMAAPHVSGIVALMLEADPSLTADQVATVLQNNARPLPGTCIVNCGAGIVDAGATIASLLNAPVPDAYEEDDTAAQWKAYTGTPQDHNFADDAVDWVATYNFGNNRRVYEADNLGIKANACISVYLMSQSGGISSLLAQDCDSNGDGRSRLVLDQPPGGYLVRINNEGGFSGSLSDYTFSITNTPINAPVDSYEPDDTAAQWSAYTGVVQNHNFADDTVDWIASWNSNMNRRTYETFNVGQYVSTCITVYSMDANNNPGTILGHDCGSSGNGRSRVVLDQPVGGYLIKVRNANGVTGVGTDYSFRIINQPL